MKKHHDQFQAKKMFINLILKIMLSQWPFYLNWVNDVIVAIESMHINFKQVNNISMLIKLTLFLLD